MTTGKQLAGLLLLTSALTCPGIAFAQGSVGENQAGTPAPEGGDPQDALDQAEGVEGQAEAPVDEADVSIPGGAIIVTGRVNRDPARSSPRF